jgi:putative tricarboxylic transport membrane protein
MRKHADISSALFIIVVAVTYFGMSFTIPVRALTISARLVPQAVGVLLIVLATINLVLGIKNLKKARSDGAQADGPVSNYKKVALTLLFITIYTTGLAPIGFLISSFLFLCAQIFLLAPKEKRKPVVIGVSAVACTGVIYFLFQIVFKVNLPSGILG